MKDTDPVPPVTQPSVAPHGVQQSAMKRLGCLHSVLLNLKNLS